MQQILMFFVVIALAFPCAGQTLRPFNRIFPNLDASQRRAVFSSRGLTSSVRRSAGVQYLPQSELDKTLADPVLSRNPTVLVELLMVIPAAVDFLDVYNAVSKIKSLKDPDYHSPTLDHTPLFADASRIVSATNTSDLPDPPRLMSVPRQETFYLRLRDDNFGDSYYRADIAANSRRFLFTLSNVRSVNFLFVPIIRSGGLVVQLYFEPVAEGMMAYSIGGADIADFILSIQGVEYLLYIMRYWGQTSNIFLQ